MLYVAIGSFVLSMVFRYFIRRKEIQASEKEAGEDDTGQSFFTRLLAIPNIEISLPEPVVDIALSFRFYFQPTRPTS